MEPLQVKFKVANAFIALTAVGAHKLRRKERKWRYVRLGSHCHVLKRPAVISV